MNRRAAFRASYIKTLKSVCAPSLRQIGFQQTGAEFHLTKGEIEIVLDWDIDWNDLTPNINPTLIIRMDSAGAFQNTCKDPYFGGGGGVLNSPFEFFTGSSFAKGRDINHQSEVELCIRYYLDIYLEYISPIICEILTPRDYVEIICIRNRDRNFYNKSFDKQGVIISFMKGYDDLLSRILEITPLRSLRRRFENVTENWNPRI